MEYTFSRTMLVCLAATVISCNYPSTKEQEPKGNIQAMNNHTQQKLEEEEQLRKRNTEKYLEDIKEQALEFKRKHPELLLTGSDFQTLESFRSFSSYRDWSMYAYVRFNIILVTESNAVRRASEPANLEYTTINYYSDIVRLESPNKDAIYMLMDDAERGLKLHFFGQTYRLNKREVYGYFDYSTASAAISQKRSSSY